MKNKELIESGNLELYVCGLLSAKENYDITQFTNENLDIENEIIAIEKSIIALSIDSAPNLSVENYNKIKQKINIENEVIPLQQKFNKSQYFGWIVAAVFLLGCGILFHLQHQNTIEINALQNNKKLLEKIVFAKEIQNKNIITTLKVLKDENNLVIKLSGQAISPNAFAKVYWNKKTSKIFIDASGLPTAPNGMVYQVWSLQLTPSLLPTSIGFIDKENQKTNNLVEVYSTFNADAFGITLEPIGGSKTPTMKQLYTLGKV